LPLLKFQPSYLQTTRCYITDDSKLHTHILDNLKFFINTNFGSKDTKYLQMSPYLYCIGNILLPQNRQRREFSLPDVRLLCVSWYLLLLFLEHFWQVLYSAWHALKFNYL